MSRCPQAALPFPSGHVPSGESVGELYGTHTLGYAEMNH
jgi:hypothetical protein